MNFIKRYFDRRKRKKELRKLYSEIEALRLKMDKMLSLTGRWGESMFVNYESSQMRVSHLTDIFRSKITEYEKLYPNDKLFDNIYHTEQ